MGDLSEMCHTIRSRARLAVAKASVSLHSKTVEIFYSFNKGFFYFQIKEYQASFSSYRYLWTDDRYERKIHLRRVPLDHRGKK